MFSLKAIARQFITSTAITTLSFNSSVAALSSNDIYIYAQNSCWKGMILWYELIDDGRVSQLSSISIKPGERKLLKTTPYRWFRSYAKTWDGSYEWDGNGRKYIIDGEVVQMREQDLNKFSGDRLTITYPCSNI